MSDTSGGTAYFMSEMFQAMTTGAEEGSTRARGGAFWTAYNAAKDIKEIWDNPNYTTAEKQALSAVILATTSYPAPYDIPITYETAWEYINITPEAFEGIPKDELFQWLAENFPEHFYVNDYGTLSTISMAPDGSVPSDLPFPVTDNPDNSSPTDLTPDGRPVSDISNDAADDLGDAEKTASPLVLDLDGDGIELASDGSPAWSGRHGRVP